MQRHALHVEDLDSVDAPPPRGVAKGERKGRKEGGSSFEALSTANKMKHNGRVTNAKGSRNRELENWFSVPSMPLWRG